MHPSCSNNPIRLTLPMLTATCVFASLATAQSDLAFEPYPVFVAQEGTHARCGPSDEYYRTDPLRHGQELEVYAETDDGWLGIRPPDESFCWLPADTVEMDESSDSGIVTEDRTVAWIGTQLGRARTYRWQVQLAEGEPVTVIGRSEREGPDGPQLWYRIVPPSGEYRWVHRDRVVMSSEELVETIRRQSRQGDSVAFSDDKPSKEPQQSQTASTRGPDSATGQQAELSRSKTSSRRRSPEPRSVAGPGPSILEREETVGSGLNQGWESAEPQAPVKDPTQSVKGLAAATKSAVNQAMERSGLLASVEFLSRPRLLEIGDSPSAPSTAEAADDANWIAGAPRPRVRPNGLSTISPVPATLPLRAFGAAPVPAGPIMQAPVMQASGQQPISPITSSPAVTQAANQSTVVSAQRIAQIEAETLGADVQRLSLIFSRLIAAQATAAETEPVGRAARHLASSSLDSVVAGRARLLAERADQYGRVANQRDGDVTISTSFATEIPRSPSPSPALPSAGAGGLDAGSGVETATQTGYLVQVYSARSNSPPFALTDDAGRTVAYVTPLPGVNLRTHLNSKVSVFGNQGFLTGLSTPHILATQAVRTPQ